MTLDSVTQNGAPPPSATRVSRECDCFSKQGWRANRAGSKERGLGTPTTKTDWAAAGDARRARGHKGIAGSHQAEKNGGPPSSHHLVQTFDEAFDRCSITLQYICRYDCTLVVNTAVHLSLTLQYICRHRYKIAEYKPHKHQKQITNLSLHDAFCVQAELSAFEEALGRRKQDGCSPFSGEEGVIDPT